MNSFPLLFGKEGNFYQIDKVIDKDDTTKHLMDIGFVKNSILKLVSNEKKGVIVNTWFKNCTWLQDSSKDICSWV